MPPTSNDFTPLSENKCSQSKCKAVLPIGYQYKSCEKCRSVSMLSMRKKRKREKTDEGPSHSPVTAPGSSSLEKKGVGSDMELICDESKVSGLKFPILGGPLLSNCRTLSQSSSKTRAR